MRSMSGTQASFSDVFPEARRTGIGVRVAYYIVGVVSLLLAATACNQSANPPQTPEPHLIDETNTVQMSQFWFGRTTEISVSDDEAARIERAGAVVLDPPPGWHIRVAWTAAPCETAPTVRLSGTEGRIATIVVTYGPQVGVDSSADVPVDCPASLEVHGIDIKTSRPPGGDIAVSGKGGTG
jgi:hypothetical protein